MAFKCIVLFHYRIKSRRHWQVDIWYQFQNNSKQRIWYLVRDMNQETTIFKNTHIIWKRNCRIKLYIFYLTIIRLISYSGSKYVLCCIPKFNTYIFERKLAQLMPYLLMAMRHNHCFDTQLRKKILMTNDLWLLSDR